MGKFAEKSANFAGFSRKKVKIRKKISRFPGFSREKSQNSRTNRLISRDFHGRKVKIRRKIGRFRGFLAEKNQISKEFHGQIVRKIDRIVTGNFVGKIRQETFSKKQPISLDVLGEISLKSINLASI